MKRLQINGRNVEVSDEATVLAAAQSLGIEIPTLCHHPDLTPVGSCRLCLVEVAGCDSPVTSCNLNCEDGMEVTTESPSLAADRKAILELLLCRYHDGGYTNPSQLPTEFEHWVEQYGAKPFHESSPRHRVDQDDNPFLWVDFNKCILCTRCVRACQEVQGRFVWNVAERGDALRIVSGNDTDLLHARCESCGACAAYCPTGALADRTAVSQPPSERKVRTTCGYCGVGCQFDLHVTGEQVVRVTSDVDAPVNGMSLCVKGRYGHDFVHHTDRLVRPRVRKYLLDGVPASERPVDRGEWVEVSWETALDMTAQQIHRIRENHGAHACGVLSSAKCTNEENYLVQKFARQVLGTNNVDHCARLCHSSTVAGLAMAIGSGAMTNSMDDIAAHARAILVIGSNTTEQHPVFGAMLRQSALRGTQIVVADPRCIDLVEFATLHLQHRPGSDVALINGLMHLAIANQWHHTDFIQARCEGFDEFAATIEAYPPERVSSLTDISVKELKDAAEILCKTRPMAVIWSMGITQHVTGVNNVLSLANLQLLLGNLGQPGGGLNPLRGQNNVQGACDMGALPNVYPSYQPVDDPQAQQRFNEAWNLQSVNSPFRLDTMPGRTVTELVEGAGKSDIRALYVVGEDLAMTEPDVNHACECLQHLEFFVLQEIFPSETAAYADVLLPGASFAEKDGSFTNTDRRIQPIRRAIAPVGEAQPDWQITSRIAERVLRLQQRSPKGDWASWNYEHPNSILREINAVAPAYAGATPTRMARGDRLQWPISDPDHPGTPILHTGEFPHGRGKFTAVDHLPPAELPDEQYPMLLTTGRVLYHWHGGEMTRRSQPLAEVFPEPLIEMSPSDARTADVNEGQWITIQSRRGELTARARITTRVPPGVVFANFHFPGSGNANNLTVRALDPVAKIPEYKVCAVRLAEAARIDDPHW